MKSFRMLAVAGLTATALILSAVPSDAAGPGGQRHRGPMRGPSALPRPMPQAVRPMQPRLTPGFGVGRAGLSASHLRGHGLGYGLGYGYGYYDPFWSVYGMGSAPGYYGAPVSNLGGVRIKNAPRDAEVYVDGAYAGIVDSFDGRFQRLTLEPGGYRIDVRRAGVEQTVNVNVQPGRTTTISIRP